MIRVALVEDDGAYVKQLTGHLRQYEKERGEKILITVFQDGEDIVTDYTGAFDIILMDVEMQFMDGMTAAEQIREMDTEVIIIFITNMPQYAIRGYRVDAFDYVLKPVPYFAFSQRLERALGRLKKKESRFITLTVKNGIAKLDVSTICYVEVQDHDIIYHTTAGNYSTKSSMGEAEELLDREKFFRCHRCYLINLECVESFQGCEARVGGNPVPVSRYRKKLLMDALNNYMNGVGT